MNKAIWIGVGVVCFSGAYASPNSVPAYSSAPFRKMIADSYKATGNSRAGEFFALMDAKLKSARGITWKQLISKSRATISRAGKTGRTQAALNVCQDLHRAVKQTLPTFTLDRGFEFSNAALNGERQCLLQSVFIAGLLQEMKVDAGIAMVWRNDKGQVSNMGHVCTVVALPNGKKVVVDASDPTPFIDHGGLFLREGGGYRFIEPSYKDHQMVAARDLKAGKDVSPSALKALDLPYVRSQFDFYRGERFSDGVLSSKATKEGLAGSEKYFCRSLDECARNPLSTWLLSQTLRRQGKADEAAKFKGKAVNLYKEFGWLPPSLR